MNISKKEILKIIAKVAYREAKKNANSASVFLHGQPPMPEKVRKMSKHAFEN